MVFLLETRIVYGISIVVIVFIILTIIPESVTISLEEWQLWFFFFASFLFMGIIVTGVLRSMLIGFTLGLALTLIMILISSPQTFSRLGTEEAFQILLNSAIASALGAAGGFLGNWVFED